MKIFVQANTLFCILFCLSACAPSFKLAIMTTLTRMLIENHEINKGIDKKVLRPSSKMYAKVLGQKPRTAISNFSENWGLPKDLVNYTLQGDIGNASKTTGQFLINSTIGIAGVFDPSEKFGINARGTDFGETLHRWEFLKVIMLK